MANLEDLIARVSDGELRAEMASALRVLKRRQRFGLVFEEHIPETTALVGLPVQVGSLVQRRDDLGARALYRVTGFTADQLARIEPFDGGDAELIPVTSLLVVQRFGDPIFPVLTSLGSLRRGEQARPTHAVINAENYHALQLLLFLFERQVDCIYIDPPYNTGARDWKYNNRYVDDNDTWRHSKWLSFMAKRLQLARRLLRPDGVLICTIDEHELHHLGMLLEKVFPAHSHYMINIVINPKGRREPNFSKIDEQAFFVVPKTGTEIVQGSTAIQATLRLPSTDVVLSDEEEDEPEDTEPDVIEVAESNGDDTDWEYRHARRRGAESSYRHQRPNQFYPIFIDEAARRVVRVGGSIPLPDQPDIQHVAGLRPIRPIDAEGRHRCWRYTPDSMLSRIERGEVVLGRFNQSQNSWTINIRYPRNKRRKLKTVWWDAAYDAGTHGTQLLSRMLGAPGLFPFPKSVYAVRDCLAAVVRNRPQALIVDFFAGSGTTFHATCLLNSEDAGQRRSILVTNNEVAELEARQLYQDGHYRGDPAFEAAGIFERVTWPRCEATVTGFRPDGKPVAGKHIGGRPLARGFAENIEFFRLDYLDPDDVDLGLRANALLPLLWLAAGGVGERGTSGETDGFMLPQASTYGVLYRESRFRQFRAALEQRPEVTHVWLVTDSEQAYAEMAAALPADKKVAMLYRDYLRHFRVRAGHTA
jgi:adenine-specific DNA-methyltransferase